MTTKRDLARYRRLVDHGCVCCKLMGVYTTPEMHHIVDKGYRKHSGGNQATLPLCPPHHRGGSLERGMGPAIADGSKLFARHWGSQRELLDMVNANISELA